MKANSLLTLMAVAGIGCAMTSSCSENDVYNPEAAAKRYETAWEKTIGKIDPMQNWNTAKQVTANLSISEDALSTYKFKIYDANPLYNSKAQLLAATSVTTDAQGTAATTLTFNAPIGMSNYYVVRVDNHARRGVKLYNCEGNELTASFGGIIKTRTNSDETFPKAEPMPYSDEEVNKFITEGKEFSTTDLSALPVHGYDIDNVHNLVDGNKVTVIAGKQEALTYANSARTIVVIKKEGTLNIKSYYTPYGCYKIENLEIIVAEGGTLNIDVTTQITTNGKIIVMPGGTLNLNAELTIDGTSGGVLYNAGTINAQNQTIIIDNKAKLHNLNNGIIKVEKICLASDESTLNNYGKISANEIKALDATGIGSGTGNLGTINTGCFLYVEETLDVRCLNMAENTAIQCKKEIRLEELIIRNSSLVKAEQKLDLKDNVKINCLAEQGKASLISAPIIHGNPASFSISGNVYLETNEFETITEEQVSKAITEGGSLGLFRVEESPLTITPSYTGNVFENLDCTGSGNIPVEEGGDNPNEEPIRWIVACEDLGNTDDFDFNDIVFGVSYNQLTKTLTVTPLAAGGTIPANIYYKNEDLGEIHNLLGASTTTMTNTQSKGNAGEPIEIENVESFDITDNMGGLTVRIAGKESATLTAPTNGTAPQMLYVPSPWYWPIERTSIVEAYPGFGAWGANYGTSDDWYKQPAEGTVVQ